MIEIDVSRKREVLTKNRSARNPFIFVASLFSILPVALLSIDGYDKVEWGASFERVVSNYEELNTNYVFSVSDDPEFPNLKGIALERGNGKVVTRRNFLFWENSLAKVSVVYDPKQVDLRLLLSEFEKRFGQPVNSDEDHYISVFGSDYMKYRRFYREVNGANAVILYTGEPLRYFQIEYSSTNMMRKLKAERERKIEF